MDLKTGFLRIFFWRFIEVKRTIPEMFFCFSPNQVFQAIKCQIERYLNKGNAKRGVSPRLNIWPGDLDRWPWKSIGFQILLRTKYVPKFGQNPLKDVESRVFTGMSRGKNLTWWPWPLTLNIIRVPNSPKD